MYDYICAVRITVNIIFYREAISLNRKMNLTQEPNRKMNLVQESAFLINNQYISQ